VPRLILASTSSYRRELLARLRLPFEASAPGVSEDPLGGEAPAERALRLARAKAHAVARQHPDALVIGSDQVAALGDELLEKPGHAARCAAQLRALSGRSARFYTACVLVHGATRGEQSFLDTTTCQFRELTAAEIERYVAQERPFDCAGGFKAEGLGISLFERIESHDPTALIGLPLIWLAGALRAHGLHAP
jgi:septum formation protein